MVVDNIVHRLRAEHHLFTVHLLDFVADGIDKAEWLARRSQHHCGVASRARHVFVRNLAEGNIKFRVYRQLVVKAPLLYVPDHPNDLCRANVIVHENLTEGIFPRKKVLDEILIDHRHMRRTFRVFGSEETAAHELDSHHFQVVRLDFGPDRPIFVIIAQRLWPPFDPEWVLSVVPHGKGTSQQRHRLNTWNGSKPVVKLKKGGSDRGWRRRLCRGGKPYVKCQHMVRIEPGANFPKTR